MNVSIIIPNYNGQKLLKENLPFILRLKNKWNQIREVIIVDDGSTDKSRELIKINFPEIILFEKEKNSGFVDTVNFGVNKARGDIIFLLNTDVKPNLECLPKLLAYFKDEKVFGVGCLDNSLEDGEVIKRGRGIGIFDKGFLRHKRGEINLNNTLWVSAGSGIFNKSIWQHLGGLDKIYSPFYWEDIDISYRALKAGYKIYFEKEAIVTHYHDKSVISTSFNKYKIEEITFRNQILFVWKNISDIEYLIQHIFYLPIFLLKSAFKGRFVYLFAFLKALIKIPIVLDHRFKQKKLWIRKDREILGQFMNEYKTTK